MHCRFFLQCRKNVCTVQVVGKIFLEVFRNNCNFLTQTPGVHWPYLPQDLCYVSMITCIKTPGLDLFKNEQCPISFGFTRTPRTLLTNFDLMNYILLKKKNPNFLVPEKWKTSIHERQMSRMTLINRVNQSWSPTKSKKNMPQRLKLS